MCVAETNLFDVHYSYALSTSQNTASHTKTHTLPEVSLGPDREDSLVRERLTKSQRTYETDGLKDSANMPRRKEAIECAKSL